MTRMFTYQTRLIVSEEVGSFLDSYAALSGKIERTLFVDLQQDKDRNELKSSYIDSYKITARQYNAIKALLEGKIQSVKEGRLVAIKDLKEKICTLEKKILKIKSKHTRHEKKRKLHAMKEKLTLWEAEHKSGKVSICFGGKKLFRAQFHLQENGYSSLEEWKADWTAARNSEFFCLGSKDETAGNQSCQLFFGPSGEASLKVRLPNSLTLNGSKYLLIENVFFSYGADKIQEALNKNTALSYRFKKDKKGWRVFLSFAQEPAPILTKSCLGAIGIDINSNHMAAVDIDAKGNPIHKYTFTCNSYGKRSEQTKAIIGDVCKELVDLAKEQKKPLVIEKLDFTKKKAILKEGSPKYARMLSSFHYSHFIKALLAKGYKEGVEIFSVNPAMTSIIGKIKYAKRYGLTYHQGAALVIARRHYQFSEVPSKSPMQIVHKNAQVTCPVPVRKRGQHVWAFWREANRKLTVLAALFRAQKRSPCPS